MPEDQYGTLPSGLRRSDAPHHGSRIPLVRLLVEAVLIVGSILFAFAIERWGEERRERASERRHLEALALDLVVTAERLDSSLVRASRGLAAGDSLAAAVNGNESVPSEKLLTWLRYLRSYYPFTPVVGAYQAMAGSGETQLIESVEVRSAIASFYGGFERTRGVESLLVDRIGRFTETRSFEVYLNRVRDPTTPLTLSILRRSDELTNWIGNLRVSHSNLVVMYEDISERVSSLQQTVEGALRLGGGQVMPTAAVSPAVP